METELHFVEAVGEAEDGEVRAFNHRHYLVALTIIALTLIVSGDRNEVPQLLGCQHILQKDALIHLVIESDLVKCLFQLPAKHFIVNKCLFRQEMQVLLEGLTDELLLQV